MLKSFDGSVDVATWLKKVKLVAQLKKVDDIAALIPLYLEGPAFAVFDQLSATDQKDADIIEQTLLSAFALNQFSAFDVLRGRCLAHGESVDVYLADVRRLAGLAKIDSEEFIRCAFVTGLPRDVSLQMRAAVRIGTMSVASMAEQARILVGERSYSATVAAVGKNIHHTDAGNKGAMKCFECGGDHHVRVCGKKKKPTCWTCNAIGHLSRNCPGNEKERSHAPTPSQVM